MNATPGDAHGSARDYPSGDGAPAGELVGVYRTLPARILGWLVVVAVVVVGFVVVRGEFLLGRSSLMPLAATLFVISLSWVFLLRPCVELRSESVTSRNILRDVYVPFSRLAEVDHMWSVELTDRAGRRWSSWAVPKQREFSARRAFDTFSETTRHKSRPGTTAQVVAGDVQVELQHWLSRGGTREEGAGAVVTWAPLAVGPLGAATFLLAVAVALG